MLWETALVGKSPVDDQQAGGGTRSTSRGTAGRSRVPSPRPSRGGFSRGAARPQGARVTGPPCRPGSQHEVEAKSTTSCKAKGQTRLPSFLQQTLLSQALVSCALVECGSRADRPKPVTRHTGWGWGGRHTIRSPCTQVSRGDEVRATSRAQRVVGGWPLTVPVGDTQRQGDGEEPHGAGCLADG